jgi:hypothetical protein
VIPRAIEVSLSVLLPFLLCDADLPSPLSPRRTCSPSSRRTASASSSYERLILRYTTRSSVSPRLLLPRIALKTDASAIRSRRGSPQPRHRVRRDPRLVFERHHPPSGSRGSCHQSRSSQGDSCEGRGVPSNGRYGLEREVESVAFSFQVSPSVFAYFPWNCCP